MPAPASTWAAPELRVGAMPRVTKRSWRTSALETPIGLHTFPVENGAPVILDPRLPRNCLDCGVALLTQSPVVIDPRDAIEWTAQLAEAGAANLRNGPSRVRRARNAIMELVDEGAAPDDEETIDSIAWLLSLAESVARRHGPRAISVVRTTAQAVADLADEALARAQRNIAWLPVMSMVAQNPWMSALARIGGRVGLNMGAVALQAKLKSLGIDGNMVGLVEQELNREGMTMGTLASPTSLPTFEKMFNKNA